MKVSGEAGNAYRRPRRVPAVRVVLVALLLTAACAGCLSGPVEVAPAATRYLWGLSDCQYVIAVVTVPADRLAALLPSGFAPRPGRGSLPGAETGELHADAYTCGGAVGLDGRPLHEVEYGSFYVPVDPPAELREPGYEAYFVKLDFLAPDASRTETLLEAGLPVHGGEAFAKSSDGVHWSAMLYMPQVGRFGFEGIAGPPEPQGAPLPFVEHSPLAGGGLALWHARLHGATFATGVGTLSLEGPMAEVAGAPQVPVTFSAGTWNLDEADLTFPIAWPASG